MAIASTLTVTAPSGASESLVTIASNGDGGVRRVNTASAANLPELLSASKKDLKPSGARTFPIRQITVNYSVPVAATATTPAFTVNYRHVVDIPLIAGVDMLPYVARAAIMCSQYFRNAAHVGADVTGGKYGVNAVTDLILGML